MRSWSGSAIASPVSPATIVHVHHHVTSTFFQSVAETEAGCRSYYLVTTQVGVDHWGRYHDTLVPDPDAPEDRWVFAERRVTADGFHEDSLFRRS